ncbi:MAG TPA: SlyX family protein [Pseudomonadales bacterium]|nr:SlyX family protein [Pseudomonadales bacterium]
MNNQDDIVSLQLRVDELETRLAFQEDTLQALSEQLAHQQGVTEQQQQMMQTLYRQLRDVQDASSADGAAPSAQERPPHY